MLTLPQQAVDFIIAEEAGGKAYYEKFACRPTWPGGASGLTIGVGYDLGQQTAANLQQTWGALLGDPAIARLTPAIGLKGGEASREAKLKQFVQDLHDLTVPWDDAVKAFQETSLPHYLDMTLGAFPGLDKLNGLCVGAVVSLVYNRGTGMAGDSRTEMKAIRDLIQAGTPQGVPDQFRAMKRLWPSLPGLQKRRDAEADMFQQGLNAMAAAPAMA